MVESGGNVSFIRAADDPHPESLISYALPWIFAAGDPYYSWLFGSANEAKRILDMWMRRPSSEVSIRRVQFLMCDAEIAGGFIALGGRELKTARKADTVALLTAVSKPDRPALMQHLASSSKLFLPVAENEFYLSKIGLNESFRGRGFGRVLLDRYVSEGERQGYRRFRLDVYGENATAIRQYEGAGFQIVNRVSLSGDTPVYYAMTYRL